MAYDITTTPIFTTGQIARICCVAPRTVCKWIDGGVLDGYRIPISQDRRVKREDFEEFIRVMRMAYDASLFTLPESPSPTPDELHSAVMQRAAESRGEMAV